MIRDALIRRQDQSFAVQPELDRLTATLASLASLCGELHGCQDLASARPPKRACPILTTTRPCDLIFGHAGAKHSLLNVWCGFGARHDMAQGGLGPPFYSCIFVRWWSFAQIRCGSQRNSEMGEQKSLTVISAKPIVVHEQINKATDGFRSFDRGSASKTNFASKRRGAGQNHPQDGVGSPRFRASCRSRPKVRARFDVFERSRGSHAGTWGAAWWRH